MSESSDATDITGRLPKRPSATQTSMVVSSNEANDDRTIVLKAAQFTYPEGERPGSQRLQSARYVSQYLVAPEQPKKGWKVATLILSIITVILATTTIIAFTRINSLSAQIAQETAPAVVASEAPTSVPTLSPKLTVQPSVTAKSQVLQENRTLTCSGCNEPIHVTINTIQIDTSNDRMIWDTTLKDITNSGADFEITEYTLQASSTQPGVSAILSPLLPLKGTDQYTMQATFAFVPFHNVTYTLTLAVYFSGGVGTQITYDQVKITF